PRAPQARAAGPRGPPPAPAPPPAPPPTRAACAPPPPGAPGAAAPSGTIGAPACVAARGAARAIMGVGHIAGAGGDGEADEQAEVASHRHGPARNSNSNSYGTWRRTTPPLPTAHTAS